MNLLDQNHVHTYYQDVLHTCVCVPLRVCSVAYVCVCSRNFVAQYMHKFVFVQETICDMYVDDISNGYTIFGVNFLLVW